MDGKFAKYADHVSLENDFNEMSEISASQKISRQMRLSDLKMNKNTFGLTEK